MSDQNFVNRRDFVKTAGSAMAATSLLGADAFAQAPSGPQALRDHRHWRTRNQHVGAPDPGTLFGRDSVRRAGRHQPEACRSVEGAHGRRLPDLHQLRRDARQDQARHRHGDDAGFFPQPVHRPGARSRLRRHDREADGHRRKAVPGRTRRREAQQEEDHRHLQLPVCAEAPGREGNPDVGRDRQSAVSRLCVVSGRLPWRGLFPPVARV